MDKVVATVMTNPGLEQWAKTEGIQVFSSPVGDEHVAAVMKKENVQIGGEQNGHIILPGQAMGDGMLAALMMTKALVTSGKTMAQLGSIISKYPFVMLNMFANAQEKQFIKESEEAKKLLTSYEEMAKELQGKVLLRPSGTEDIYRISLWGKDEKRIQELSQEIADKLRELIDKNLEA